jgi:pilus assembly protein Flp/PilA
MLDLYVKAQSFVVTRLRPRDESGQALVEYALILALIAVVSFGALNLLGANVNSRLSSIANSIGPG